MSDATVDASTNRVGPAVAFLHDLGLASISLGFIAIPTLAIALLNGERAAAAGLLAPLAAAAIGAGFAYATRRQRQACKPNPIVLIASAWALASLICAVPYVAAATPDSGEVMLALGQPLNALFESMSGLTSTGLTVASDPQQIPLSLQWWRSTTQWLGGVGILYVVFGVTLGSGEPAPPGQNDEAGDEADQKDDDEPDANQPDAFGPIGEGNPTRDGGLGSVVRRTWLAYGLLTLACFLGLWAAGMSAWDAANHAQTTLCTGGFSTRPDSLASYAISVQIVAFVGLIVGAISFHTHRHVLLAGDWRALLHDRQARWLVTLIGVGALIAWPLTYLNGWDALFQVGSALATCGFSTASTPDLNPTMIGLLTVAMLVGGPAASTVGGLKLARLRRLLRHLLKLEDDEPALSESVARTREVAIAMAATFAVGAVVVWLRTDTAFVDAAFEAASALGTVGLSAGLTAPDADPIARATLIALMWLGRLEAAILIAAVIVARRRLRSPTP